MCPNFAQLKAASEVWLEPRHTVQKVAADLSSKEVLGVYHPTPDYAADENILALQQTLTPHSGCEPDSRLTLGETILQKMVQEGRVLWGSFSQKKHSNSKNTLNEPPLLLHTSNTAMCLFKAAAVCLFYSTLLELFSSC